jgi:hypothetical protein
MTPSRSDVDRTFEHDDPREGVGPAWFAGAAVIVVIAVLSMLSTGWLLVAAGVVVSGCTVVSAAGASLRRHERKQEPCDS